MTIRNLFVVVTESVLDLTSTPPAQFEMLILEGAQAGLSWRTILGKRDAYRKAFHDWDLERVAKMSSSECTTLLEANDADKSKIIVRNKLKVHAAVDTAKALLDITKEHGSLDEYFWSYMPSKQPLINYFPNLQAFPAQTDLSKRISDDLQKRGCRFVGPKIIYAFMQSCGMVNDHQTNCFLHPDNQKKESHQKRQKTEK